MTLVTLAVALGTGFHFNAAVGIVLIIALGLWVGFFIQNCLDKHQSFKKHKREVKRLRRVIQSEFRRAREENKNPNAFLRYEGIRQRFPGENEEALKEAYDKEYKAIIDEFNYSNETNN